MPSVDNFKVTTREIPKVGKGEVLIKTLFLSVDPYMQGRIGGRASSHPPFALDQPANGDGVGRVVESSHPDFNPGDYVSGFLDWADYSLLPGSALLRFDPKEVSPAQELSVLGAAPLTGYFGLLDIGQPKEGETVVISGAAGAVGMTVGQIAKIKGCRVVGIAGSDLKADYLREVLGFDEAINYKSLHWMAMLEQACSKGVDIYFDNVGGAITDEVMKKINRHARVVLCGQISSYNLEQPDVGPRHFRQLIVKSALAKGFLVRLDYQSRFPEGRQQMHEWLHQGKIKPCETIIFGLENIPKAFLGLFTGENLGKQLVQVE
jgi:NADPH-dependent curcumin reductase CurA